MGHQARAAQSRAGNRGLRRLDRSEKGSIMRHMRTGRRNVTRLPLCRAAVRRGGDEAGKRREHMYAIPDVEEVMAVAKTLGIHLGPDEAVLYQKFLMEQMQEFD